MPYEVRSTEKLRKSGSETETKALLYLMNFRDDSDDIYYFVIDFFNDLTGMDRMATCLWDVQSKGTRKTGPKAIGRELVTLFKNFVSEITFKSYILFIEEVSGAFRKNSMLTVFGIENVKDKAIELVRKGLIEEGRAKSYIDNTSLTDINIDNFLSLVTFVVNDKEPRDYVKAIIKRHPKIIPEDKVLDAIFNEIRDKQSSKKNICDVEGVIVETTDAAINYYRHLTSNEIRLMTLQRIINRDPLHAGVPISFIPVFKDCPPEQHQEVLDDCQAALCRALFNKNTADGFWLLFENVYELIVERPTDTVDQLFREIRGRSDCINACPDFNVTSLKYFIATIKDGLQK